MFVIKRKYKTFQKVLQQVDFYTKENPKERRTTFAELERLSQIESAAYIYNHLEKAVLFKIDEWYWSYLISKVPKEGLLLEFGVFGGRSINYAADQLIKNNDPRTIYGFDSFEGLSEDWSGTNKTSKSFTSSGKLPEVRQNVQLTKGWVEDTFLPFLDKIEEQNRKMAYVHFDMDVYTPTKFVLENIFQYLVPGTIINFDELLGFPGWKEGEYKVMQECLDGKCKYEHIAYCELENMNWPFRGIIKAAIRITEI